LFIDTKQKLDGFTNNLQSIKAVKNIKKIKANSITEDDEDEEEGAFNYQDRNIP